MIDFPSCSVDLITQGKSVLTNVKLQFQGFELFYSYHEIPRLSITLSGFNFNDVVVSADFTFKLTIPNGDSYSMPFYVKDINQVGDNTVLIGFVCTLEFMKTSRSKFLGADLKKAISNCCGHLGTGKLKSVTASGKFFQINETDYHALLRLLKGMHAENNWAITESEIVLLDPSDVKKLDPGAVDKIVHNIVELDKSEPVIDDTFKDDFWTQGWYRNEYIESSSPEYVQNVLSASKKLQSYENLLPVRYRKFISMPVGQRVNLDVEAYRLKQFDIFSKVIRGNQQFIETELMLGVNNG